MARKSDKICHIFCLGSLKFGCQFCFIVIFYFKSLCYLFSGCWVRFC
ncbi:hypothetical protein GCWU000324_00136 [Kingella oralis ATCC 51147]|uniref:Uncharacterized protein n=1 Tax=Kingella oralis ATCC 51147 TaxID=629741 RepID=C4GEP9_9NEIS|nr:hypothetical protein GCWU000324_00136 [Kingella oralis ATCC 51147]